MLHLTTRKCIPSPLKTGTLSESGELELDELLLVALAGDVLVGWDDCLSEEDDLDLVTTSYIQPWSDRRAR